MELLPSKRYTSELFKEVHRYFKTFNVNLKQSYRPLKLSVKNNVRITRLLSAKIAMTACGPGSIPGLGEI